MDIGGDVRAAKTELRDGMFQHSRGARRFLYRHGSHRSETIGMFFAEFMHALVVEPTPAFSPFAMEVVSQNVRARVEGRQRDLALIHHCDAPHFICQSVLQCTLRPAAE